MRVASDVTPNSRSRVRLSTTPPRLALTKTEAAEALGVSIDFFRDHIQHELRCVRRGRRKLYSIRELERWLEENEHLTLGH